MPWCTEAFISKKAKAWTVTILVLDIVSNATSDKDQACEVLFAIGRPGPDLSGRCATTAGTPHLSWP